MAGQVSQRVTLLSPLTAIAALVCLSIALAATARLTGFGATRLDPPTSGTSIDLRFADLEDGGIRVIDVSGRRPPQSFEPGRDGFVRVAMRSLARERQALGIGAEPPFRLGRQDDGRLWLQDTATGRLLYLDAYGQANARSFARLIDHLPEGSN